MFFLFILIILLISFLAIYTSKIQIQIENLKIDTEAQQKINKDSKFFVNFVIFKKVKIFKRKIDINKLQLKNKDLDITILKDRDLKIDYKNFLQETGVEVEKIDLFLGIGTQDAALTAILVGIISAILGILIRKPKYQIIPIYSNKNLLKIKLDCIFSVSLMQYIYKVISNQVKDLKKSNLEKVEV